MVKVRRVWPGGGGGGGGGVGFFLTMFSFFIHMKKYA